LFLLFYFLIPQQAERTDHIGKRVGDPAPPHIDIGGSDKGAHRQNHDYRLYALLHARVTLMWPAEDELPARDQPLPWVLDLWQRDVRELGPDLAEQAVDALAQGVRAEGDREGHKHDQQGVFGRRGAPFVPLKAFDRAAHLVILRQVEKRQELRPRCDSTTERVLIGPAISGGPG